MVDEISEIKRVINMKIEDLRQFTAGESLTITATATTGMTAAKLIFKKINVAAIVLTGALSGGIWTFTASAATTAVFAAGDYTFQMYESSSTEKTIYSAHPVTIKPNLETSSTAFDPRSADEIILEAVIAVMSGTASQTQRSVSVGDKSLQYMSFSELAEKRAYFEERVYAALAELDGGGSGTIFTTFSKV